MGRDGYFVINVLNKPVKIQPSKIFNITLHIYSNWEINLEFPYVTQKKIKNIKLTQVLIIICVLS